MLRNAETKRIALLVGTACLVFREPEPYVGWVKP